jgi:hypothetical protein
VQPRLWVDICIWRPNTHRDTTKQHTRLHASRKPLEAGKLRQAAAN